MRILFLAMFYLFLPALAYPMNSLRQLADLWEGDEVLSSSSLVQETPTTSYTSQTRSISSTFGGVLTHATTTSITPSKGSVGISQTLSTMTTQSALTATTYITSMEATAYPTATVGFTQERSAMPAGEATEWKVIGIAIIAITFVATVILAIVFFDSWWGFLRDLMFGKRKGREAEDLVPDWEKRSWEFKLSSEDGHRYPTMSSLESMTKIKREKGQSSVFTRHRTLSPDLQHSLVAPPQALYSPEYDPHPLEPLIRRPSTRPQIPTFSGAV